MLFLITCVPDEGVSQSSFVVIEAGSELEIAQHILSDPSKWECFLNAAFPHDWRNHRNSEVSLIDCIRANPAMTPEELLELINSTFVDGSSAWQLRIHPVAVKLLEEIKTDPWN